MTLKQICTNVSLMLTLQGRSLSLR